MSKNTIDISVFKILYRIYHLLNIFEYFCSTLFIKFRFRWNCCAIFFLIFFFFYHLNMNTIWRFELFLLFLISITFVSPSISSAKLLLRSWALTYVELVICTSFCKYLNFFSWYYTTSILNTWPDSECLSNYFQIVLQTTNLKIYNISLVFRYARKFTYA